MTEVTLEELYRPFARQGDRPALTELAGAELPEPYRGLLDHFHHMTVTVESFYESPVRVVVLEEVRTPVYYARKILLTLESTGRPVQFGIVRVELDALSAKVRDKILAGRTPLGRVLIDHQVLREVRPVGFFRARLSPQLAEWFALDAPEDTYGRLGVITSAGEVAVRVAEILVPVPKGRAS